MKTYFAEVLISLFITHIRLNIALLELPRRRALNTCRQCTTHFCVPNEVEVTPFAKEPTVTVRVISQNPFGSPISVDNPFGNPASGIAEALKEILELTGSSKIGLPEPQVGYRLDYLIKFIESKYVPVHTKEFFSLTHSGKWNLIYSSSLAPKADDRLSFAVDQMIIPDESHTHGTICNRIHWRLKQEQDDACGILEVDCAYKLSPKGAMQVSIKEHVLSPDVFPNVSGLTIDKSCEILLELIQTSVPYETFDPDDTTISTSFLDPAIRVSRVLGLKYPNVINVFKRISEI